MHDEFIWISCNRIIIENGVTEIMHVECCIIRAPLLKTTDESMVYGIRISTVKGRAACKCIEKRVTTRFGYFSRNTLEYEYPEYPREYPTEKTGTTREILHVAAQRRRRTPDD